MVSLEEARNWIQDRTSRRNWRDEINLIIVGSLGIGYVLFFIIIVPDVWGVFVGELRSDTYLWFFYLFKGIYIVLAFLAITEPGDEVAYSCLTRIRSPLRYLSYDDFIEGVDAVKKLEQHQEPADENLIKIGKNILTLGVPAVGMSPLRLVFVILGLFSIIFLPLGLPVMATRWLEDGISGTYIILLTLLFYMAFYSIAVLYISLSFQIRKHYQRLGIIQRSPLAILFFIVTLIGFIIKDVLGT